MTETERKMDFYFLNISINVKLNSDYTESQFQYSSYTT